MTEYPYDFGTGYKIQTVYANKTPDGGYGDIYDFASEVTHAHPGAEILKGYCVIDVALGLVPDGCNDWNETIPEAISDYESHVQGYDEDIEITVVEEDSLKAASREIVFKVNCHWLQNYFGVDNQCQLEALLTNSEDWEPAEILNDAMKDEMHSGLQMGDETVSSHIHDSKSSLDTQIQSALSRSTGSHSAEKAAGKSTLLSL